MDCCKLFSQSVSTDHTSLRTIIVYWDGLEYIWYNGIIHVMLKHYNLQLYSVYVTQTFYAVNIHSHLLFWTYFMHTKIFCPDTTQVLHNNDKIKQ